LGGSRSWWHLEPTHPPRATPTANHHHSNYYPLPMSTKAQLHLLIDLLPDESPDTDRRLQVAAQLLEPSTSYPPPVDADLIPHLGEAIDILVSNDFVCG
jgi:hypothetical protein